MAPTARPRPLRRRWVVMPLAVMALVVPVTASSAAEDPNADLGATATPQAPPDGAVITGDCFGYYSSADSAVIFADPDDEYTWGTSGDDIIIGSEDSDMIYGLGGDDRICAGGGNDWVESGILPDRSPVTGEFTSGDDVVDEDWIDGGTGLDVLNGSDGPDHLYGGPNDYRGYHDWLYAEGGDDHLYGERGPDVLVPGPGQDYCDGGTGVAAGWPEDDSVVGTCDPVLNVP